jgi:hypothetical protein
MKIAVVVVSAWLVAAMTAPSPILRSPVLRKDRAAMLIYEGRDRVVARLPADTANLALILLSMRESESDTVALSQLANRPCIGIALFSTREWAALTAGGRQPSDVRPSEATMRLRVYPATTNARAAVENIQQRIAYVSLGLEFAQNPLLAARTRADSARAGKPLKWSVQAMLDSAHGHCSVE